MADLAADVTGVAALAEPVRRDLYLYVVGQDHPVSRDEAAEAQSISRHAAKFHLDRLVEAGLLATKYRRLSGLSGPGAGRPSKLYFRADRQVSVELPERRYQLAGTVMARAIETAARTDTEIRDCLDAAAAEMGTALAKGGAADSGDPGDPLSRTGRILAALGYEPRIDARRMTLANCPFHLLAAEHTELVCGINVALLEALVAETGDGTLIAELDPAPGRCCVVLRDDPHPAQA